MPKNTVVVYNAAQAVF